MQVQWEEEFLSMSWNKNNYKPLLFIFCLGLILRLLFVFLLDERIYWFDGFRYDSLARNLVEGRGYTTENNVATSFRAPGYPFFLALIYLIFGHSFLAVRIVQALLDLVTMFLIFNIGKLLFEKKVAITSILIYAIYPLLLYSVSTFFPATLFTFLLALVFYLTLNVKQNPSIFKFIALGVIIGLSILTVPTVSAMIPFLLFWIILSRKEKNFRSVLSIVVIISAMVMTMTPWLIRNYVVHKKPLFIASNGGYNFWMGNNPHAKISTGNSIPIPDKLSQKLSNTKSEIERERIFYQDAFQFIKANPKRFISLTFLKALNLWHFYPTPTTGYKTNVMLSKALSVVSCVPILILAIFGMIFTYSKKKQEVCLFVLLFLTFTAVYAIFFTKVRFRIPLDPYLIIFASYSIVHLWERKMKKKYSIDLVTY
jgi:4-amino-4-deoxy-L-arabinose transferase-like glycosyltransferase